jgi:hypothetical protein
MDMRDVERNEVVMKLENVGMASDRPMIGTLLWFQLTNCVTKWILVENERGRQVMTYYQLDIKGNYTMKDGNSRVWMFVWVGKIVCV